MLAAEPPALIPFQGHLARPTTADPNKFESVPSGQYDLLFTLYAAPVGGESQVWGPERHRQVVVVNGVVNAMLGSVVGFADPIAANPNFFARPLYVGITVDADGNPNTADLELVPRQVFLPAVQALNAGKLDGADWQTFFVGTDDKGTFTPGTTKAKDAVQADHATTADSAILASTVAVGAVGTAQLADGSVTAAKISGGTGVWLSDGLDNIYHDTGNVGIGTTAPATKLDVNGNAKISGTVGIGTAPTTAMVTARSTGIGRVGFKHSHETVGFATQVFGDYALVGTTTLSPFGLTVGGFPVLKITRNGNVGIALGSSDSTAPLQVGGDIKLGPSGQYFAPGAAENLRIVRGIVRGNTSGGLNEGVGYTVANYVGGAGAPEPAVVFSQAFSDLPSVTLTMENTGEAWHVSVINVSTSGFSVRMWRSDSVRHNAPFHFIAVGPR